MLRRCHHARRGKFQFAPPKVARVMCDQMFHATGYRQFQNVVIIRIRQVWPPAKINRPPGCRSAKKKFADELNLTKSNAITTIHQLFFK